MAGLCAGNAAAAVAGVPAGHGPEAALLPLQGAGTGLTASYFTNGTLAGAPAVRRLDTSLDFKWGKQAPAAGIPEDNFSVRWEGQLAAPGTGNYRFVAKTNGEVRLWVNGKKVLDTWNGRKLEPGEGSIGLAAGEKTSIKVEYGDMDGDDRFQLLWIAPGSGAQVIPTSYLYPLDAPATPEPAVASATPTAPAPATPAPAKTEPAPAKTETVAAAPAAAPAAQPAAPAAPASQPAAKPSAVTAGREPGPALTKPATFDKDGVLNPGVYILTSRPNGKPLEVVEAGRPNRRAYEAAGGAAVEGRSTAPQWRIESLGNGYYRLIVPGNNKVLEVLGSSTSNGQPLSLWTYYSGNNQLWKIEPAEGSFFKLVAKHSNKALTAKDSIEGGLQQWRYSGRPDQQWKIEAVVAEQPMPVASTSSRAGIGANNMSIYPNPSNGVVQLAYELPTEVPVGWVLYNQRGAAVRMSDYRKRPAGAHHQTLEFTSLPPGDYYLHLTVGTSTTKQSLMIRQPQAEAAAGSTSSNP